jgi:hypothetical protein
MTAFDIGWLTVISAAFVAFAVVLAYLSWEYSRGQKG